MFKIRQGYFTSWERCCKPDLINFPKVLWDPLVKGLIGVEISALINSTNRSCKPWLRGAALAHSLLHLKPFILLRKGRVCWSTPYTFNPWASSSLSSSRIPSMWIFPVVHLSLRSLITKCVLPVRTNGVLIHLLRFGPCLWMFSGQTVLVGR